MSKIENLKHPKINDLSTIRVPELTQTALNWTAQGMVGPVNNQGQCGSCWAFSATESIQSAYAVAG